MKLLVVSFYTPRYADDAARLRASLLELAVPHRIAALSEFASWKDAVLHKPQHIAEELCALSADFDGLLWTDADSILRRPLPMAELEACDLGLTRFRWTPGHQWELLSGTMFFRRCQVVYSLVNDWCKVTPKYRYTDTPEQVSMAEVLGKRHDVRLGELSAEWCSIFDAEHGRGHRPIFEHYQASRTKK